MQIFPAVLLSDRGAGNSIVIYKPFRRVPAVSHRRGFRLSIIEQELKYTAFPCRVIIRAWN